MNISETKALTANLESLLDSKEVDASNLLMVMAKLLILVSKQLIQLMMEKAYDD